MKKLEQMKQNAYLQENSRLRKELAVTKQELESHKLEKDALAAEHKYATRKLSFHEKREKARSDGLKKAQQTKKKAGSASTRRSRGK